MSDGEHPVPAKSISEMLLERTGQALLTGDFEAMAQCFTLPLVHATLEGVTVLRTREDLEVLFGNVRSHFRRIGMTHMIRFCVAAEYAGPDRVNATHETHLFNRSVRLAEPFRVMSELVRIGGEWRIASSNYAVTRDHGYAAALLPPAFPSELDVERTRH